MIQDIPLEEFEEVENCSLPAYFPEICCSQLFPEDISEEGLHTAALNRTWVLVRNVGDNIFHVSQIQVYQAGQDT